jgi:hypothetical protein
MFTLCYNNETEVIMKLSELGTKFNRVTSGGTFVYYFQSTVWHCHGRGQGGVGHPLDT